MNLLELTKDQLVSIINELTKENIFLKTKIPNNNQILFSDYIEKWVERLKYKWQDSTYEGYSNIIYNHISPYFKKEKIYVNNIKPSDIEGYFSYKIKQGYSGNTIRKHHANIRKCLKSAMKDGIIKNNPALLVDLPKYIKPVVDYYQLQDLLVLYKYTRQIPLYSIILLTSLGLRRSEAIAVKWSDINFDLSLIEIKSKIVPVKGNPIKEDNILKNNSSYRILPIPDFIIQELKFLYDTQAFNLQNNISNYCSGYYDYVCVNKKGKIISLDQASHQLKYLINKHNLKPITLKGLRHTCATIIGNDLGYNLKYAQEWLGHSTITITANTYSHINLENKKKVSKGFDKLLNELHK